MMLIAYLPFVPHGCATFFEEKEEKNFRASPRPAHTGLTKMMSRAGGAQRNFFFLRPRERVRDNTFCTAADEVLTCVVRCACRPGVPPDPRHPGAGRHAPWRPGRDPRVPAGEARHPLQLYGQEHRGQEEGELCQHTTAGHMARTMRKPKVLKVLSQQRDGIEGRRAGRSSRPCLAFHE